MEGRTDLREMIKFLLAEFANSKNDFGNRIFPKDVLERFERTEDRVTVDLLPLVFGVIFNEANRT